MDGSGSHTAECHGTVTWVSGNEAVAKVSSTGNPATIEGVAAGSTTITATYAGESYTCNLTVTPNLSEDAVTVSPENPVYNGGQQIPSVAVQVGDTILKRERSVPAFLCTDGWWRGSNV